MVSSFEKSSNHIINDTITAHLCLEEFCNLRLTCRSLANSFTNRRFRASLLSKYIDVTEDGLECFAEGAQAGDLRSLVQNLTLTGIVMASQPEGKPNLKARDLSVTLLSRAFKGLAEHGNNGGKLRSLSLRVAVISDTGRRILPRDAKLDGLARQVGTLREAVWSCAIKTLDIALSSLAQSQLRLENLDVFDAHDMQHCGIAWDRLGELDWHDIGHRGSLTYLRSLSASLASSRQAFALDESNLAGLDNCLRLCKRLEDIELHYLSVRWRGSPPLSSSSLLQRVASIEPYPFGNLQRCRLRGVSAHQDDLLALVSRAQLRGFSMEMIRLVSGTFRPIFNLLTGDAASITSLYLDRLHEHGSGWMIYFLEPEGSGIGDHKLARQGEDVKNPIVYHFPVVGPCSTPTTNAQINRREVEYGPVYYF